MQIRATTDQDYDVFVRTLHTEFGLFPEDPAEDGGNVWWAALEMDRGLLAVTDDGRPVGTAAAYTFELTLPGEAVVPTSGVTAVGVVPWHRRRGTLTAMMRRQLADVRERGEYLSVLLASEALIYRRFGYGPATFTQRIKAERQPTPLAPPRAPGAADTGSVEVLRRAECAGILEEVYDRYRRTQPGALSRPHRWWERRAGQPPVSEAKRYVAVHRDADGVPDGYASYAIDSWIMSVDEVITAGAAADTAFTALVRLVLEHDLVKEVVFQHVAPDSPLRHQLTNLRAAAVDRDADWLWVRLLDVPGALTARGWFTDGELVLDVDDPFLGERSRWLLTVHDGKATCVPTEREPELSLDISDLGSLYLGGTLPSTFVRAGHVRAHGPDVPARADALFRGERAPHCLHWF
ncbi:UPF0256 protein [Streptomyces spiroverticillatus]|uniref:UPF0256 protein n=1 Tax=Streptomyces finlayi TaxID=67296 RepID=A0A918X1X7_9ACTN|nr:GNAT family N-acetyltransferase [Streptomyces finlayi]GHA22007.1 UPF0256 protein [Streptomyces spiroverticillatus]GHD04148.1 UPF0256 protein [Streptomyces finlayi]